MQLHEQYRPTEWVDLIANKGVIYKLERIRQRGLAGRSYWISGPSGSGKTTIARLIAAEVATEWAIEEADATDLTALRVRDLERASHLLGLGTPSGRVYIVNEAHAMHKPVVRQLLTTLERIPSHVVWVFTTTSVGQRVLFEGCHDASPLVSRCTRLEIDPGKLIAEFAERACRVAEAEGLDGKPIEAYVELIRQHTFNLRAVLQEIEGGAMVQPKEVD